MLFRSDNDRDASRLFEETLELRLFKGENISATVGLDFEFGDNRLMEGGVEELDNWEDLNWSSRVVGC